MEAYTEWLKLVKILVLLQPSSAAAVPAPTTARRSVTSRIIIWRDTRDATNFTLTCDSGEPLAANFLIISSEICRQYKILVFYELYDDFVCGTEIIWVFCMRKGILYGHYPHKSILYENLSCKSPLVHPAGNGAEEGLLVELALLLLLTTTLFGSFS